MLSLRVTQEHDQRLAANNPLMRTCLRLFLIMGSDLWNVWLKSPHALPALDANAISTMAGDDPVSSAPLIGRTPRLGPPLLLGAQPNGDLCTFDAESGS